MTQSFTCFNEQAHERHGIELTWSPEVLDVLADGYNIRYGARSLKHEVRKWLSVLVTETIVTRNSFKTWRPNTKFYIVPFHKQVDRRVVNQLAAAFEQQLIKKGTRVHIGVGEIDSQQPTIKLQVLDDKGQPTPDPSTNPSNIQYSWQPS